MVRRRMKYQIKQEYKIQERDYELPQYSREGTSSIESVRRKDPSIENIKIPEKIQTPEKTEISAKEGGWFSQFFRKKRIKTTHETKKLCQ